MTEHDAFLEAIREAPDDDVGRLMYADWLDERGHPRGEFIRAQCELAHLCEDDPLQSVLQARAEALLATHGEAWRAALPTPPGVEWGEFHRGFVEGLAAAGTQCTAAQLEAAVRASPVRSLELYRVSLPVVEWVASCSHSSLLQTLEIRDCFLADGLIHRLAASRGLVGLRRLVLERVEMTDLGAAALVMAARLPRLEFLSLAFNRLYHDGPRLLAESSLLGRLTGLDLSGMRFSEEALQALAASPRLGRLRTLRLGQANLDHPPAWRAFAAMLRSGHLENLTGLGLAGNHLRTGGIQSLCRIPLLARLTDLDLEGNDARDAGAAAIAATDFPALRRLNLRANRLGNTGVRALAGSRRLGRLQHLDLRSNDIGDGGLNALVASVLFPRLTDLLLDENRITDASVEALAASPEASQLRELHLDFNEIGDDGALALSVSPSLTNLRCLTLYANPLGRPGAEALRERFGDRVHLDDAEP